MIGLTIDDNGILDNATINKKSPDKSEQAVWGEASHVRFCGNMGVKFLCMTRLSATFLATELT